jgi:hypothetical protein
MKDYRYIIVVWVVTIIILASLSAAFGRPRTELAHQYYPFMLSSTEAVNGSTILLKIDTQLLTKPIPDWQIRFQDHLIPVFKYPVQSDGAFLGLLAIPWHAKPGQTFLIVEWTDSNGIYSRMIPFNIVAGKYRTEKLKVNPQKVNLSKKDLARVKREKKEVKGIYSSGSFDRFWSGIFQLPLNSDVTSPFGNKRMFNGQLRSYHNGVDFRAPIGKSVYAANSGIVRLTKNLFFSGNIVIIDHGTGVFTNYAHLSRIDVSPNQHIEKGQRIGLSGNTGRVNGPHLHWGIKVNGTYVDPLQFVDVIDSIIGQ